MAWSWSHTPEAYSSAYDNLHAMPHDWLAVCYAEWLARYTKRNGGGFYPRKYPKALKHAKTLPEDILADAIWGFAEAQQTCDNGGWNAWACPHGCHSVSFSCSNTEEF